MGSGTGSSHSPELAAALHRLRSTLARMRAELEVAEADSEPLAADQLVSDLRQALDQLGEVEVAALAIVRVLVLDDDERLGELMARGLRRLGFDAEFSPAIRPLRSGEVVVIDLGLAATAADEIRSELRNARPIIVSGAADAASRALAVDLAASDYLVKPVEIADLAAAIRRRVEEER